MTCALCGSPCQGRHCTSCELAIRHGARAGDDPTSIGVPQHDPDDWEVEQAGLGDADAEGQATLDGGIAREGQRDE